MGIPGFEKFQREEVQRSLRRITIIDEIQKWKL